MATRIEGLDRLRRRLARLPPEMKRQVKEAISQSADALMADQRRFVPVDDGVLRDSIRKEELPETTGKLGYAVKAGSDRAFYAAMVEFGTTAAPSSPFFFPPYRAQRSKIRSRIRRAVRKAVRDSARG